ncbi:MAG TPA: DUF4157 domain-containing protein [Kofleriaceae bacterium]|nr:DUF4157 domain-containing protein [Kofleriaceae bacterium]
MARNRERTGVDELEHQRRPTQPTPGKTTLTSRLPAPVQRATAGTSAAAVTATADETQTIAEHGVGGATGRLPFADVIAGAFGRHDMADVRVAIGGAATDAAGALGARAYATGNTIAFAGEPDLHLAAHEAAHIVQQRAGVHLADGLGRPGDQYERHADAVADAVVRGESAEALLDQHAGAGGGGVQRAVQLDDDDEEGLTRAQRRELRRTRHQGGRREAQDRYLGTRVGVVDQEGAPVVRHVGGGDSAEPTDLGGGQSVRGGTTRTAEQRETQDVYVDQIDEEERSRTRTRTRRGAQEQALDTAAMAADLRQQLQQALDDERALQGRPAQDGEPAADPERIAQLERDIALLGRVDADDHPAVVAGIAGRHRMLVAPQYRTIRQDLTTHERGLDPEGTSGARVRYVDRETVEETRGDVSRTSVRARSQEVDLDEGSFTSTRRDEDTFAVGDARGQVVDEQRTRVVIDEGVQGSRRRERRHVLTDGAGVEHEDVQVRERRGGIVADENGWGVTGGTTRRDSQRHGDDEEDSVERRRDLTIRENGVSGATATDRDFRRGARTFGTRTSVDGSFTIDIEQQNRETPPTYRLVFTIHVGVAGRVQGQHGGGDRRGVRAGGHVGGSASADLVLRRTLTAEEAEQYWSEAQRAERQGAAARSALPEFERLARIRAGIDNADQLANAGAIAGSPDAARQMDDGEESELTIRGGFTAGGNLGHRGAGHDVGVEGEIAEGWLRRVLVSRTTVGGQPRVRITVTYERDESWHVGGQAGVGGGGPTVGVRRGGSSGDGESVRFTLDPGATGFDQQYATIVRTTGRDELRALADDPAYQAAVDYTERTEEDGSSGHEQIAQGAGVRVARTGHYDERVRRGRDGALSGEANGSQDTSLDLRNGDTVLASGGGEGSAHVVVERDGQMDVTLEEREHASDPLRTGRAGAAAMRGASGEERARHVLGASPGERLRQLLSTEYSTLRGFLLDEGDLETVVARAGDRARWDQCASSPRMLDAWHRLRAQLRNPHIDPEEAAIDEAVARRLAIARHLARFFQAQGEPGHEAMHNVLRNWGAAGVAGVALDSRDEQLGSEFEWPHALRSRQGSYESIRAEVRDLERAAAGQATQGDTSDSSEDQRYARALHLHEQLTAIYTAVAGSSDFANEGARASLLHHIDEYRTRLRRLRVTHRERERDEGAARDGRAQDQGDRDARVELELARAQVDSIVRRLAGFKAREQAQLRHANALSYSYGGREEAVRICGELHSLAQTWYREVAALRRAYQTIGMPRSEWLVSTPGGPRSRTHEPEVGWLIQIYLRCHEGNPIDDGRGRAAQWRQEFRSY